VAVISRDRAGVYAEGARDGAPKARQVADRWHLVRNLTDVFEALLRSRHGQLREAARVAFSAVHSALPSEHDQRPLTSAEQVRQDRRTRRLARYQEVMQLHEQGATQVAISRQLGLGRHTVRRWLRAGQFPEWTVPERPSALRRFLPHLEQRWAEGCRNAARLWREICEQGYTGRAGLVRQWIGHWKRQLPSAEQPAATRCATPAPKPIVPTLRRTAWLCLRGDAQNLAPADQAFLTVLRRQCPELAQAAKAAVAFLRIVSQRDAAAWPSWLEQARGTLLARFAAHLRRDEPAVVAALETPWSNGPVEGQVIGSN
jgi:transposase